MSCKQITKSLLFSVRKWAKIVVLLSCSIGLNAAIAQTVEQAVNSAIKSSRGAQVSDANVGIIITSADTGDILYGRNIDSLYTPASIQKLFTAAAALQYLKPEFTFKTVFYTDGSVRDGVLHGNLYVRFDGDPTLKLADLSQMTSALRNRGIQRIAGRVYIDNYAYNAVPYPPGFIWDDLSYGYSAPIDAIIIDRNKFALTFTPQQAGYPPHLSSNLPMGIAQFTNNMRTTDSYNQSCPITIYSEMDNQYTVGGCLDRHYGTQSRSLAVRDMLRYAQVQMTDLLKNHNINFEGSVEHGQTPANATALVVHASEPLRVVIRHMLKKSDNLYTNAIFKKIGEAYYEQTGTWQNSSHALANILKSQTGINFKKNQLEDGAGLSRYNLVTPHQLTQLLYYVYHSATVRPALIAALPISGVDGTLEWRMGARDMIKQVHAKTGSMTGVSSLAGYVNTRHHGTLAFAIIVNNFVGGLTPYRRLEDRICEALVRA